jgi:hypothetical protein
MQRFSTVLHLSADPMNWTCPNCSKVFLQRNQPHACQPVDLDTLFQGDRKRMVLLQRLMDRLGRFGSLKACTTPRSLTRSLTLSSRNGFCIIYPRKESLELGFLLQRSHEDLPVYKIEPFAGTGFVHWTRIYDGKDIDSALLRLLREAYQAAS